MPGRTRRAGKPGRHLKVTPDQVQAIRDLTTRGEPISRVARITGLSRRTIYGVLRNEKQHLGAA